MGSVPCFVDDKAGYSSVKQRPNPQRALKTEKGADAVDDRIGLLVDDEDDQAAEDESSDSEGSVGSPALGERSGVWGRWCSYSGSCAARQGVV